MMVSTKLHPGVNFWIQGALCASPRLELTRRWFVILMVLRPFAKKPDGAQNVRL